MLAIDSSNLGKFLLNWMKFELWVALQAPSGPTKVHLKKLTELVG